MKKHLNYQPLIVEEHPKDYHGYEFITLIKYNDQNYLTIVDNINDDQVIAYVLDFCQHAKIDEEKIIKIANHWYEHNRHLYPISIEFFKNDVARDMSKIIRCFSIDFIVRVIGPIYKYDMQGPVKVKRRKKKSIPKGIEFTDRTI
jgi:hypothetical protein